jgi:putative transposase
MLDMTLDKPVIEPIGIDLGVKDLAVVSTGEKYKNINKAKAIKKANKRLNRLHRQTSRQYEKIKTKKIKGKGKNLLKLEKYINKTYQRLTNVRNNYIHQKTTELVKAKPEYVVIEDLNVSGMMKNRHLSKAIAEQKLHEFSRQLEYKCQWYGIPLIIANRFYPSSKLCSCCGKVKKDLNLSDRVYRCECGNVMDRDLQAAINLREYPKLAKAI